MATFNPKTERERGVSKDASYIVDSSLKKDIVEAKERVERMIDNLKPLRPKQETYSIRQLYQERESIPSPIDNQVKSIRQQISMTEVEAQDFLLQCKRLRERIEQLTEKYGRILNSSKIPSYSVQQNFSTRDSIEMSREMPYVFYKPGKRLKMDTMEYKGSFMSAKEMR